MSGKKMAQSPPHTRLYCYIPENPKPRRIACVQEVTVCPCMYVRTPYHWCEGLAEAVWPAEKEEDCSGPGWKASTAEALFIISYSK